MTDQPFSPFLDGADSVLAHAMKAGAALAQPKRSQDKDAKSYALVPDGFDLREVPTFDRPARPVGTVKLRDAASFITYVNDHKVDASRIYASLEPASFLAVFDDHETSDLNELVADQADFREFRASFQVPASREWKTWESIDRKDLNQLAFATFLEDNLPDVLTPDSASLLDMVLNFEAAQGGKIVAAQRLQDGSTTMQFVAENNASGSVKLPETIRLNIPVFENESPRELDCRLRYRIKRDDGTLTLRIERIRPHKVLEDAFRQTWGRIATGTSVTILLGSPE